MNMNRLRPPKNCPDLALWLSCVVHDAVRDAKDAGLSDAEASILLSIIARQHRHDGALPVWLTKRRWHAVADELQYAGGDHVHTAKAAVTTPEQIAAKLESTADGRLVRAWLLRVVDGDDGITDMPRWVDAEEIAEAIGLRPDRAVFNLGAAARGEFPAMLTELGKLVAQACRPKPWVAASCIGDERLSSRLVSSLTGCVFCSDGELAERVAELLTAADLAAAKEPK